MNVDLKAALDAGIGTFATSATEQVTDVLPIALPVAMGIGVVFLGIRLFRAMASV